PRRGGDRAKSRDARAALLARPAKGPRLLLGGGDADAPRRRPALDPAHPPDAGLPADARLRAALGPLPRSLDALLRPVRARLPALAAGPAHPRAPHPRRHRRAGDGGADPVDALRRRAAGRVTVPARRAAARPLGRAPGLPDPALVLGCRRVLRL